jgi:hypothetical protein
MSQAQRQHLRLVRDEEEAERGDEGEGDAGASPVTPDVISNLLSTLANLVRTSKLEFTLKVGQVVIEQIYRGDLDRLRQRGPKDASFRKLAAHPRLPFSAVTLWRSVAIYELIQRFPGFAKAKHLGVAHLRAVLGLPHSAQERLLRAAETGRWSKDQLEERAAKHRKKGEGRTGRSPTIPALRCLRRLHRLTSKATSPGERLDLAELDDEGVSEVQEHLERVRTWCSTVERALAERAGDVEAAEQSASSPMHCALVSR